jgi:trimethylamine--corrinoid protein Co-methyltransferase
VQIGHEKTLTGIVPVLARTSMIYGLGMLDMGMAVSYEQLLIDSEFVRMFKRIEQGITVDADTLAVEVIKAVGPASNFLGQKHTRKHMHSEISTARLIDRRNHDVWLKDGGLDMVQRANIKARELYDTHRQVPLSDAQIAAMDNIIATAAAVKNI